MKKTSCFYKRIYVSLFVGLLLASGVWKNVSDAAAETSQPNQEIIGLFGASYKPKVKVTKKVFEKVAREFFDMSALSKITNGTSPVVWNDALKKLCRYGKWTTSKTFTSCKTHAKKQGWLGKPLSPTLSKKSRITHEQFAILLTRMAPAPSVPGTHPETPLASQGTPEISRENTATIPERTTSSSAFTPHQQSEIETDFFANILLSKPLPNRFYKDEVYVVEGELTGKTADDAFVFLCRDTESCDNSENFIEKTADGKRFSIPVHFEEAGNFQIGIIPGRAGESRIQDISVLADAPAPESSGVKATDLSVQYEVGKTVFRWNGTGKLTRLVVFQGQTRRDYIFRGKKESFAPKSKDFKDFKKGPAAWFVEIDGIRTEPTTILLTIQDFRKIESKEITVENLQETFAAPGTLRFQAKAVQLVSRRAAITWPDGHVEEIKFATADIQPGDSITIEKNLSAEGTFIFEVNNTKGGAVVNVPMYVGSIIPLLPDTFALNEPKLLPGPVENLAEARLTMLALINADRKANGLSPVLEAMDIHPVAQAHSANMVNQRFFGHVDPAGNGPDDRRREAGITTPIRENLGKATSLELVEAGLMRSPVHRDAILDSTIKRVGIGIAKDQAGYFFVTQNFAGDPLTAQDLPVIESTLFDAANTKRAALELPALTLDPTLQDAARAWSRIMALEDFLAETSPSGQKLVTLLRDRGVLSALRVHMVEVSESTLLEEEIAKQSSLQNFGNRKIGIGLAVSGGGNVFLTTVYTP